MKIISKNFFAILLVSFILLSPLVTLGQNNGTGATGQNNGTNATGQNNGTNATGGSEDSSSSRLSVTIKNPISVSNINDFIRVILVGVVKIGIPIVALAIIYSGFLFVTARGNEKSLETAKKAFMYSVIGAAILLGSWAIAQLISDTVLEIGNSI
jgi:hypothetical protein